MRHRERFLCGCVSLCNPGSCVCFYPQNPPASVFQLLGFQACSTTPDSSLLIRVSQPLFFSSSFLLFFLFHLRISVSVYVHGYTAHVWWSDSDYRSQFRPCATCVPGAQTRVVRLGIKHLCLLGHLARSQLLLYYTDLSTNE